MTIKLHDLYDGFGALEVDVFEDHPSAPIALHPHEQAFRRLAAREQAESVAIIDPQGDVRLHAGASLNPAIVEQAAGLGRALGLDPGDLEGLEATLDGERRLIVRAVESGFGLAVGTKDVLDEL